MPAEIMLDAHSLCISCVSFLFQISTSAVYEFMSFFHRFFMRALVFTMPRPQHVSSTVHASHPSSTEVGVLSGAAQHKPREKTTAGVAAEFQCNLVKGIFGSIIHHFFERKCEESNSRKNVEQQLDLMSYLC